MCVFFLETDLNISGEVLMDDPDAKFLWHLCPVLHGDHQRLGTTGDRPRRGVAGFGFDARRRGGIDLWKAFLVLKRQ